MAPTDKIRLPLRWQFVPVQDPRDRAIQFETLSDCMADARLHGYEAG